MEIVDVGTIQVGDRINWKIRSMEFSGKVHSITGYLHSEFYDAPGIDLFLEEGADLRQRAIVLPWITHRNGRRVDRQYWNGRHPEMNIFDVGGIESPKKSKKVTVLQVPLPFNEEDELAALKTSTRKGLDEMSQSHREHIEKWEPHISLLGAEHVWVSANRFAGRGGEGPVFAGIKRGSKDYAIVEYDTSTKKKAKVLADGFESSKTMMEAFKEYREQAKAERTADRPAKAKKATASKATKATKTVVKKTVKKVAASTPPPPKPKKILRKK